MDYHTLPRRQLQALCKKHGIPANAANSDMADALTALLKPQVPATSTSKQASKRATRSHESAMGEMKSNSKDVEEVLNIKQKEPANSHKIVEEELEKKQQRGTRGRGTACAVLEAFSPAAVKMEKALTNGETESKSATKRQGNKKVSTRSGASKQSNSEMPTSAEENVDSKVPPSGETESSCVNTKQQEVKKVSTRNGRSKQSNTLMSTDAGENVDSKVESPKPDKKKERVGGIVLRRGRVKVQSPKKSPESKRTKAVTTPVGVQTNPSCLVDAKKTRKKKRSVTFSDVLEVNSACMEHSSHKVEEPAEVTMAENSQGADLNLPQSTKSVCMIKSVVRTRKGSRSVPTEDCVQNVTAAHADHHKSSKEQVAKASKAAALQTFDAEKTADNQIGGQSDGRKLRGGSKTSNSVGGTATKENKEEKVTDGFIKGEHFEDVTCTRRSRRLTIVPTDVNFNQDMQLDIEQLKGGHSKDHDGSSISANKTQYVLPAETSRKSRRKTLAPIELNHVQSNVASVSEQKEKRILKQTDTQRRTSASELQDEDVESKEKCSVIKTCDGTTVSPQLKEKGLFVRNVRGTRQKAFAATKEVSNGMSTTEITSREVETNMNSIESEKDDHQAPLNSSFPANYEPHSSQEVLNDPKVEVVAVQTTSVMLRSTRKTSKISTRPDNGIAISQDMQKIIVEQEGLVSVEEALCRNIQDFEDLHAIDQACMKQPQERVLNNTNEPRVEDPVSNTLSTEDINHSNTISGAVKIENGEGQGQNEISSEGPTAIHNATCDSETVTSSPLVDKLDAADVKCHDFTEDTTSASSSECGHEFTKEKDLDVIMQKNHGIVEMASIISLTEPIHRKSMSGSPISTIIRDSDSLDGNCHIKCSDLEKITDNHTAEGITACSPGAILESKFEHEKCKDTAVHNDAAVIANSLNAIVESTFEHQNQNFVETCLPEIQLLTSHEENTANLLAKGAVDLVEELLNQPVDLHLGGEDAVDEVDIKIHGDLQEEQLQNTNKGVHPGGVMTLNDLSKTDDQMGRLSPLLPLCSAEPCDATPRESCCQTKQRCPRSIFKSARKAKFPVPWEDNLEQNVASPPLKAERINSLDVKKDAELWGSDSHEMSCDEANSASSEEDESSAETEETLSDIEVCDFNTEVLISNTEGDYSCGEEDTPSDTDEDTMSDSSADDFSEMEGDFLSGEEELYESEELDTSEEELSEIEDDAEEDFEEYGVSPVSQSVADCESLDALCTMHVLQDQQVATIAPSISSHADNVNITDLSVLHRDPTYIGGQHEEFQKPLSPPAVTRIQENVDVQMSRDDDTAKERVQSTSVSTCEDGESLISLSFLFATPAPKVLEERVQSTSVSICEDGDSLTSLFSLFATPTPKVKEDVKCSLAPPCIDILENSISQEHGTRETELNTLSDSGQEGAPCCSPCELPHPDAVDEVEQHTVDKAQHGNELYESVDGVEKLEINGQMAELVETCVENSRAEPAVVDYYMVSPMLDNAVDEVELHMVDKSNEGSELVVDGVEELEINGPMGGLVEAREEYSLAGLAAVEQHTVDKAKHGNELCESVGGVEELEINDQMVEVIETCIENSPAEPAVVDCYLVSPTPDISISKVELHSVDNADHGNELCQLVDGVEELEINDQMDGLVEASKENSLAGPAVVDCYVASPVLKNAMDEVEQHAEDEAKHGNELCESVVGIEELEINDQMVDLVETHVENSHAEAAVVDCCLVSSMLDNAIDEVDLHTVDKANHISELCQLDGEEELEINGQMDGLVEASEENSPAGPAVIDCYVVSPVLENARDEVEQRTVDEAKHGSELYESVGGVEELESNINGQMVELAETCVENSFAGPTVVDCYMVPPILDNVHSSHLLGSDSKNAFKSCNEDEQFLSSVFNSPCLGPCELIFEGEGTKMGDPDIVEEGIQNMNTSPKADGLEVQEEAAANFEIIHTGAIEDEAGDNENFDGMALHAHNDSKDPGEQVDLREGTTTNKLMEVLILTADASIAPAEIDNANESGTETEQDHQILHLDSTCSMDDLPQQQDNEEALTFDTTYDAIDNIDAVVSLESAEELKLGTIFNDDKINLLSSDSSCYLLEEGKHLLPVGLMPFNVSEQPKTEVMGGESEVIHLENNVSHCSTPKCSEDSDAMVVFNHESLDEVAQTLHYVEIPSVNTQVQEGHEKPLNESQSSEVSNEDKEAAVEHNLISKEESMKQIDLTLLSVRKLRQMCKGTPMSAKKKLENATPAKKPWMSATKQVHQPNASMHPRDPPSGNKRSALQALSSNVKAAPSASMQTPTTKVLPKPQSLMGTLGGNEGTAKQLVMPSPQQAPLSSKRDFARSHHR